MENLNSKSTSVNKKDNINNLSESNEAANNLKAVSAKIAKNKKFHKSLKLKTKTESQFSGEAILERLERFPNYLLSFALGIVLICEAWYMFDKGHYNIGGYNFETSWFPKFGIAIALAILIKMAFLWFSNLSQFKKDLLNPKQLCYLVVVPVIIMSLGQVMLFSSNALNDSDWYAGITFYSLGIAGVFGIVGWWLTIAIIMPLIKGTFKFDEVNAAWLIPAASIGFGTYVTNTFLDQAQAWIWILWVITIVFGTIGTIIMIYRYIALKNSKDDLQQWPFISLPIGLILLGFSIIKVHDNSLILNSNYVFTFILLGLVTQAFITGLIVLWDNACLGSNIKDLKYNPSLMHSSLGFGIVPMVSGQFAHENIAFSSDIAKDIAKLVIIEIAIISAFLLYVSFASFIYLVNRGFNKPAFLQSKNAFIKAFL